MRYISTRGTAPKLDFENVLLAGLASDGGLYVPEEITPLSPAEIKNLRKLSYPELAAKLMLPFVSGFLDHEELLECTKKAYANFRHEKIAPVKTIENNHFLLELFHGPTLAFKDFALQLLGCFLDVALKKENKKAIVLGATSGDTGSAALSGVMGRSNIESFILFPNGLVSDVQRKQMTTLNGKNIHPLAVEGNFDDCQRIVKSIFSDSEFRKNHLLIAVNSINWSRILAQVVYYFYATFQLLPDLRPLRFCVPTGNFGDIFAGYIAFKLGLPIEKLIIASNSNNILTRCLNTGNYDTTEVVPTLSPSMDIQISSNFERLIFDLYNKNSAATSALMEEFKTKEKFKLSENAHKQFTSFFAAHSCSDEETITTINNVYKISNEVVDPHTAVGIFAARKELAKSVNPVITLATAHPAKFPDAIEKAIKIKPALPAHLKNLFEKEEKFEVIAANIDAVKMKINGL